MLSRRRLAHSGEATEWLAASPETVWDVVADPARIGEWSGECAEAHWVGRIHSMVPGARFRGRSSVRWLRWARTCTVLEAIPAELLVYETRSPTDSTRWTVTLAQETDGTRATIRYDITRMPKPIELALPYLIPEHQDRTADLAADLWRLGASATPLLDQGLDP